jgi:hypothetical protein
MYKPPPVKFVGPPVASTPIIDSAYLANGLDLSMLTETESLSSVSASSQSRVVKLTEAPAGSGSGVRNVKTFLVSNVPASAWEIPQICRQAINALPAGGECFNVLYQGSVSKLAAGVDYFLNGDSTRALCLSNHIRLLLQITSFVMFSYMVSKDYKELALRFATGTLLPSDPTPPPNLSFMHPLLVYLIREHPVWKRASDVDPATGIVKYFDSVFDRFKEFMRRIMYDNVGQLMRCEDPSVRNGIFKWLFEDATLLPMLKVLIVNSQSYKLIV